MLFIGIALLVAAGLALAVSSDAGSLIGLSEQQTGHIVPMLLVLILVAGGLFARRRAASELLGGLVLWVGVFAIALAGYAYRDEIMSVANRVYGELTPGKPIVDSRTGAVTFRRGLGGHFEVSAKINGADIPLIFDTGASAVVLTSGDAKKSRAQHLASVVRHCSLDRQRHGPGCLRRARQDRYRRHRPTKCAGLHHRGWRA